MERTLKLIVGYEPPFEPTELHTAEHEDLHHEFVNQNIDAQGLIYGEVIDVDFLILLQRAVTLTATERVEVGQATFLDLGSGSGRAVMLAAYVFRDIFADSYG